MRLAQTELPADQAYYSLSEASSPPICRPRSGDPASGCTKMAILPARLACPFAGRAGKCAPARRRMESARLIAVASLTGHPKQGVSRDLAVAPLRWTFGRSFNQRLSTSVESPVAAPADSRKPAGERVDSRKNSHVKGRKSRYSAPVQNRPRRAPPHGPACSRATILSKFGSEYQSLEADTRVRSRPYDAGGGLHRTAARWGKC